MGHTRPLFVYIRHFSPDKYSSNLTIDDNNDGALGTRTRCGRMVSVDKTTELWQPPLIKYLSKVMWLRKARL